MREDSSPVLSYIDIKQSHLGDFVQMSLFPITDTTGVVFQCEKGCLTPTPYNTPLRWWIPFGNLLKRFIFCPECNTSHVVMVGLYREFSKEKQTWIWDYDGSLQLKNRS